MNSIPGIQNTKLFSLAWTQTFFKKIFLHILILFIIFSIASEYIEKMTK
jgi:hypothetical protein